MERGIEEFFLTNRNGVVVRCTNYGCRLLGVALPDGADILLGYDALADYEADEYYMGALVGRYANRIAGAAFMLGGRRYELTKNDGKNYLHGSFHKKIFAARREGEGCVTFSIVSPGGEDGFPGELRANIAYALDDENRLTMTFAATSDADTHVNLSSHAYFDLSAGARETIEDCSLRLASGRFLEIGADMCPTGRVLDARGTAFDFANEKAIGADIEADDPQLRLAGGYDHCFLIDRAGPGALALAAEASDPAGQRRLKLYTTQPALQLYTGNFLKGDVVGKGRRIKRRSGFCLETQHCPDTPNHAPFPPTLLRKGEEYRETTVLAFEWR